MEVRAVVGERNQGRLERAADDENQGAIAGVAGRAGGPRGRQLDAQRPGVRRQRAEPENAGKVGERPQPNLARRIAREQDDAPRRGNGDVEHAVPVGIPDRGDPGGVHEADVGFAEAACAGAVVELQLGATQSDDIREPIRVSVSERPGIERQCDGLARLETPDAVHAHAVRRAAPAARATEPVVAHDPARARRIRGRAASKRSAELGRYGVIADPSTFVELEGTYQACRLANANCCSGTIKKIDGPPQ
jgi:hypothetical protein